MESFIAWIVVLAGLCSAVYFLPRVISRRKNAGNVISKVSSSPSSLDEDAYARFSVGSIPVSNVETLDENTASAAPLSEAPFKKSPPEDTLLVLCIMAKPGGRFASYELLQAISSAGLRFGEMNIFHYVYPETNYGIKLFSLLSAEEPGEFNLDTIGDFSCPGLMLFMDAARVPDPSAAFNIMLEKAGQLAEDLDGQLCADPKTPWTPELTHIYQNKVTPVRSYAVL